MYVCLCKGITDKDLERVVDAGANSLRSARKMLGVSSVCGSCASQATEIINNRIANQNQSHLDNGFFYSVA